MITSVRRVVAVVSAAGVIVAVLAACTHSSNGGSARSVSISASPRNALVDVPVAVSVTGLPPGRDVTVRARAVDEQDGPWTATTRFQVPSSGIVTLDRPSLGGSYTGVNPMGLFEFMAPQPGSHDSLESQFEPSGNSYGITLTAIVAGRAAASTTVRRDYPLVDPIRRTALRLDRDGVSGELDLPASHAGRRPAVVVFGGSEGGLGSLVLLHARLLAAHGYPALALAYFGAPGLPATLSDVPLEYFVKAIRILRAQPGVDPRHVLVDGASRGSEAALLLGADFPALVNGVIAGSPSSVANRSYPGGSTAAWTLRGRPVPTIPRYDAGDPVPSVDPAAVIPVARIHGPILLDCGELDTVWPSCAYQSVITAELRSHRFGYPVTALDFAHAGHGVCDMEAYVSVTESLYAGAGGTLAANQAGNAEAHAAVLHLLSSL